MCRSSIDLIDPMVLKNLNQFIDMAIVLGAQSPSPLFGTTLRYCSLALMLSTDVYDLFIVLIIRRIITLVTFCVGLLLRAIARIFVVCQ